MRWRPIKDPRVPTFAAELDPGIVQLHSIDYRGSSQLQAGDLLVVGAGNSGAEIALDAARSHSVWLSGRDTGHIPFRIDSVIGRLLVPVVLRFLFHRVLTTSTHRPQGTPEANFARPCADSLSSPIT